MPEDMVLISRKTALAAGAAMLTAHPLGSARGAPLKELALQLTSEVVQGPQYLTSAQEAQAITRAHQLSMHHGCTTEDWLAYLVQAEFARVNGLAVPRNPPVHQP